ncbi:MAG: sigma-70 family RNA polymerase sigma factor [Oscillospiraceae bacterium]|nr:sigma-70 family RNA polymerase sigma factor [Oscillospiraceae bacterium]
METLISRAQNGDRDASEQLIQENSGLIWSIVKRFSGRSIEPDDLYQLGCLGFLKAVLGYDPAFGTQFSTYAVPKIAGEIRRFLRDDGSVKVSRTLKERAAQIKMAREALTAQLGREPTVSEIAAQTALTPEQIAAAETATACTESIQQENGEDGFTLEDVLTQGNPEEALLEKLSLEQAIAALPDKERFVIDLRFYHGLTQDRAAKLMGVSQVQVSRIEKRALQHLREQGLADD